MRHNISKLALVAVLTASVFAGACNDAGAGGSLLGPELNGRILDDGGSEMDGGFIQDAAEQVDRKKVVEVDGRGIPL